YVGLHFLTDMSELARAHWLPKPVRQSAAAAEFIRRHTRDDDRIFLYNMDNIDIFFLARRLSNNGIYMVADMDAKHMHDRAQQERKRKEFLAHLPAIIGVGQLNETIEFFDDVLKRYYAVGAMVEGLQLYVRLRP